MMADKEQQKQQEDEAHQNQSISHYLGNKLIRQTNMDESTHKQTTTTTTTTTTKPVLVGRQMGEQRRRVVSLEMGQLEETMRRRPRHKRSESLGRLEASKIIYDVQQAAAAAVGQTLSWPTTSDAAAAAGRVTSAAVEGHCDSEMMRGKIYLLNSSKENDDDENQNDSKPASESLERHERRARDETRTKQRQIRGDEITPPGDKIDKKLTTKFKLKRLVAKMRSLVAGYLLLASIVCTIQPARAHQSHQRALVINVAEAARTAAATTTTTTHNRHQQHALRHYGPHLYERASNFAAANQTLKSLLESEAQQQEGKQQRVRTKRATGDRSAKLLELDALNYLQRYGYMNTSAGATSGGQSSNNLNLISEDSFHGAIMQFQRFAGIPETGSVDSLTVRYMQMPRCGNKDMSGKGENGKRRRKRRKRRKRYALQGSKWRRQELTYRISQYPTRFAHKKHEVDQQIERAFRIWSQVAPIDFVVKKEGRVHIDIRFANGEHGDGDPFDGPGNTLAHAYFPQYGGDAHFDDQEYWTVDSYAGTNIFQVAAHELGHSLGLGHSSVREALMAPFYQKYKPNFKLHADDVLAIQALYGERGSGADSDSDTPPSSTTSTTTTTESSVPRRKPAPPPPQPSGGGGGDDDDGGGGGFFSFGSPKPVDLCQDARIDAVTRTEDGNTYVFRGQHYWQIKNEGLASGSPGKISRDWDGLPGNLDAALTWSDGKTFFFKGDKYWRFFNKRREPGYPKLISVGFAGIPNNLDAAFVWSGNGKTYFFKRDKYWRFDSKQEPPVSGQYPKPLKNWVGLPSGGVDAAFKWENGMTYFFKDDLYYRFDDREFEVDSAARPAFPRSTAEWWFGCTNSNLPIRRLSGLDNLATSGGLDNEPSESSSSQLSAAASNSPPSLLLFHRKPNLSYDTTTSTGGGGGGGSGSLASRHATSGGGGSSLTRSILSSLSALFPSSTSSSSSSSNLSTSNDDNSGADSPSDWSFHRGVGEEARRVQFKSARSAPTPSADSSRWAFPLASGGGGGGSSLSGAGGPDNNNQPANLHSHHRHSSRGEQSMSELRLAPSIASLEQAGNQSVSSWLLDNKFDSSNQTTTAISSQDRGQMIRREKGEDKAEEEEEEESPVVVTRPRGERQNNRS